MVFIFPWATVFGSHEINSFDIRWGGLALIEMFVFLGILIIGLVYVWVKGDLDWIKPKPFIPTTDTVVPQSLYDKLNEQQSAYKVTAFSLTPQPPATATATATPLTEPKRPMFKPTFKKPANE